MLYEVAPLTTAQETVTWLLPPTALATGAAGITTPDAVVVAATCAESALSPALLTAVTT
jgi:hypothetical protein